MRWMILIAATLAVATPAIAQTAGTVFPSNQDSANRPGGQTMQQIGGSNTGPGVNVQNLPVRPPPKTSHSVTRTSRRKGASPAPAAKGPH